jgi:hypothetical protein
MNTFELPAQEAFAAAIEDDLLSVDRESPFYAGNYMFMGLDESKRILFKNISTREYLHTVKPY